MVLGVLGLTACSGAGATDSGGLSADARAARTAALRFDSLLAHSPIGSALDAARGDWLAAAIEATAYGAAPRPVTVTINGTARSFQAVALNHVSRSSAGVDVDSMLTLVAWPDAAVSEAILLQWRGSSLAPSPLEPFHAVYHPRGTYQLGAADATRGSWAWTATTAPPACATTRTAAVDPVGRCQPGTLTLEAVTFSVSDIVSDIASDGQPPDTFVVVLSATGLSAPRVVE